MCCLRMFDRFSLKCFTRLLKVYYSVTTKYRAAYYVVMQFFFAQTILKCIIRNHNLFGFYFVIHYLL